MNEENEKEKEQGSTLWQEGIQLLTPSSKKNAANSVAKFKTFLGGLVILSATMGICAVFKSPVMGIYFGITAVVLGITNMTMTWVECLLHEVQDMTDIQRYTLELMLIEKKDYIESIEPIPSPEGEKEDDDEEERRI